jgi:flagellar hook-length control protein FliK
MDSPAFTQALTDRVAFWVNGPAAEGQMTAELRLNPAEMGPVHIRIELDGQNAQIDFAAAAAETRQAIEASLGQLSAALEESGLKLSGGGVSDQTPQQQAWAEAAGQPGQGQGGSARQGRQPEGRWASAAVADGASESLGSRPPRPGRVGGLDLYA